MSRNIIALDFDGTVVVHRYPNIGESIGCEPVLRRLSEKGFLFVLNTMRSGKTLDEAVDWFKKQGIPLYGVNHTPGQENWTESPKVYANWYVDDHSIGCPLKIQHCADGDHVVVDWDRIVGYFDAME